jgi:hypothetical protein
MSQQMHSHPTMHTPRKHIVPTHLDLPDQVLTAWSLSLSARQLLLVLVGAGLGGTLWQHLALFGHAGVPGAALRVLVTLLPFVLMVVLAWFRFAGRYLEVWLIVLVRYRLRPTRYLWRSIRADEQHHSSLAPDDYDIDREASAGPAVLSLSERRR